MNNEERLKKLLKITVQSLQHRILSCSKEMKMYTIIGYLWTNQVSVIIQRKALANYNDPGCPTVIVSIEDNCVRKTLWTLMSVLTWSHAYYLKKWVYVN